MAKTNAKRVERSRPGRGLALVALAVVALYAWMFLSGTTQPKLGLDLQGGTQVTLVPTTAPGETGTIEQAQIDQAVEIIRNRVNGLGVAEAEVATQGTGAGTAIVISVPGTTTSGIVELVGQTALLNFRPVQDRGPATVAPEPTPTPTPTPTDAASPSPTPTPTDTASPSPTPSQTPSADQPTATGPIQPGGPDITPEFQAQFATYTCTPEGERQGALVDKADEPLITCDRERVEKFLLLPAAVTGQQIDDANAGLRQDGTSEWVVNIEFDDEGTAAFAETTQQLVGQPYPQNSFAIVLDSQVVSAPVVRSAIVDGRAEISGSFTQQTATELANVLKYGSLPLAFDVADVQQISPTLGEDQLTAGLIAGVIGLVLVVVYSLLYYRGLGLVTVFSLAIAGLLTYSLLVLLGETIGYTLTLAGIAGAIVAIGITADSFVVYFERIRDEMREGKTLRVAAETGWTRARRAIIAADLVSLIAAVVLYVLSVGGVRGFAFTLGLTTLVDIFVVFLFTKPLVTLLSGTKFFGGGHPLSGLDPGRLGVKSPTSTPARASGRPTVSQEA